MKPLIGIPSARVYNKERPYSPYVYGQMHTYIESVEQAGGVPVILPIPADASVADALFDLVDGVLLPGGQDIAPELYDQQNMYSNDIDITRDKWELSLIERCEATGKPLLGICRGMQLMNIWREGTLYQDLVKQRDGSSNHDGYLEVKDTEHLAHTLHIEPTSKLASILGVTEIKSNTHHHQGIDRVGEQLTVNAHAPDGVVEGLEDTAKLFFVGVQCHPESIFQRAEPAWAKLFTAFIASATEHHTVK